MGPGSPLGTRSDGEGFQITKYCRILSTMAIYTATEQQLHIIQAFAKNLRHETHGAKLFLA
jgi:hypothetical protein